MHIFDHIIFYWLGRFLAVHLPLKLSYLLAIVISDLHYIFAKVDRANVTANLKNIFPEKNRQDIARLRIRLFRNFAKYLVDFLRFSKIDMGYIKGNIRIENRHFIDAALSKGRGVIVLSAHIGNWELGGVITAMLGYQISAVALPHKDKGVDNFFNFQRERKGLNVIPLGKAARQCLNILNGNKIIAIAGDRDFSRNGILLDFFGKPAIFPEGPAAFSLKTQAPIVPAFTIRNKDDSFTLRFEEPIELKPEGDREKDIKALIFKYKIIFENYIRKYPEQWYMFKKFCVER